MCKIANTTPLSQNLNEQDFTQWFDTLQDELKLEPQFSFEMYVNPMEVESYPPTYPSPQTLNSSPSASASDHSELERPKKRKEEDGIPDSLKKKRQKQNEAARKCRQKRLDQLKDLEDRLRVSEDEKFQLSVKLAVLEQEKVAFRVREEELCQRLKVLKDQLDESHMMFLSLQKK